VNDTSAHVIVAVATAMDPTTLIVQNVSTTHTWTNMEDVYVTSTGLVKTAPSPLTTLVCAQAAAMAVVLAHQQKTVLHVYRTPARISSELASVIYSLKARTAPSAMNTAVFVTLSVKAVPDHMLPTVSHVCHMLLVMPTATVSVIHSGPAQTVATALATVELVTTNVWDVPDLHL